jgi:hypothetical protein
MADITVKGVSGNTMLEVMEFLDSSLKLGKSDQDAQQDPMIAYLEQAYASATANMSFEARQAYWKNMVEHMGGLPHQIQAFFTGQNDLFNNNPALDKLMKELQEAQAQYDFDKSNASRYLGGNKDLQFIDKLISSLAGLVSPGAVFSMEELKDQNKINAAKNDISNLEGGIESRSMALASKMNSGAEKMLSDNKLTDDALINTLKTGTDFANQLSKAGIA